ncbi:MAG TPA: hypothetical protein VM100_01370 [Longimicrobiales bacterium]|nr:hypothetical protein [Longimicrobiales bacterium]
MFTRLLVSLVLVSGAEPVDRYVTALAVSSAPQRDAALNGCPASFERVSDQDLNEGAGGDAVYLCAKYEADPTRALTEVRVHDGTAENCPSWMTVDKRDLNQGAQGRALTLCYGRRQGASANAIVVQMATRAFSRAPVSPPDVICPPPFVPVLSDADDLPADFNRGAGGKYIYLCIQRKSATGRQP